MGTETAAGLDLPALRQALQPLRRLTLPRPVAERADLTATAALATATGRWLPLPGPPRRQRPDLAVVVDNHVSMAIWRDTVAALVDLLGQLRAFRDVRVHRITAGPAGPGPGRLPGQPLVLVLTDGVDPAWHTGALLPLLHSWASRLPVAVVQVLPQRQWHRTGITVRRMRLRAPSAGAANAHLAWQLRDSSPVDSPADRDRWLVPVPVLELDAGWLAVWARLVAGTASRSHWSNLPAVLTGPPAMVAPRRLPRLGNARNRVQEFRSWATPTAQALATSLAAAPLNLPVIRVVQRDLVPGADTAHLAEMIQGGLLHPVAAPADLADATRVTFEFAAGVREELLAAGRRSDTARVLRTVSERLGGQVPALRRLGQVLEDPDNAPLPAATTVTEPFLRAELAALRALSGRYLARARRLDRELARAEPEFIDESRDLGEGATAQRDHRVTMGRPPVNAARRLITPEGATVSASVPATEPASGAQPTPVVASGSTPAGVPAIWENVPPRNPNFTGRAKLLDQLHEQIQTGTTAVLPHALHGMGGVGKSHLAIQYVYLHQSEYDLVCWIPAERPAQVGAAMVELAQRMNLAAGPDVASAVPAVKEALRLGRPYGKWLLVFDNAESPEAVRPFFPTGGPGSVMVTSRNPHWASVARTLEVDVFTREESTQLLRKRGPDLSGEDANELAEALGDLPLALEQAAAWRAETGMPADEYLRLFHEKRIELLEVSAPEDYKLPVAAAWNVSLDRLVVTNPSAFRLLQVCSFLAPEPIPRALLGSARTADVHPELNAALRDPLRLGRAIRDINRYSLARVNHRTNSFQMHRLVQLVLYDRMSEPEREMMRTSAHMLLAAGDRDDAKAPVNWPSYADLYPHMLASEAIHSPDPWVQQLVNNEAIYLYWSGSFDAAYDLSQAAYESRRDRLGEDDPATLKIGWWLGFMLFMLGRYQQAAEHNAHVLAAYQRTTTEDTEDLLAAFQAVAADKRAAGDFAAALEIDQDIYQRHVRALGEEEPATLNAAHNLAVSLRLAGDLAQALEIDQQTYERRVLLFGEDHPDTMESAINLTMDRRELGDYRGTWIRQQEIYDRLRQMSDLGHTQILRAQRRLASAMRKAGEHQAARAVSEEVRTGYATRFGPDHPDTVLADFGMAIDLRATGDLAGAATLGEEVLARYRRLHGDEHPYPIATELNLAITYRRQGQVARAREIDERGLEVLTRRLGGEHPLTMACAANLANDLYVLAEFGAAYARDRDTVDRLTARLGGDHPTTLICQANLAMDLAALGRDEEARTLHGQVVPRLTELLGPQHPGTAAGVDLAVRGDIDLDPMPL